MVDARMRHTRDGVGAVGARCTRAVPVWSVVVSSNATPVTGPRPVSVTCGALRSQSGYEPSRRNIVYIHTIVDTRVC